MKVQLNNSLVLSRTTLDEARSDVHINLCKVNAFNQVAPVDIKIAKRKRENRVS